MDEDEFKTKKKELLAAAKPARQPGAEGSL